MPACGQAILLYLFFPHCQAKIARQRAKKLHQVPQQGQFGAEIDPKSGGQAGEEETHRPVHRHGEGHPQPTQDKVEGVQGHGVGQIDPEGQAGEDLRPAGRPLPRGVAAAELPHQQEQGGGRQVLGEGVALVKDQVELVRRGEKAIAPQPDADKDQGGGIDPPAGMAAGGIPPQVEPQQEKAM